MGSHLRSHYFFLALITGIWYSIKTDRLRPENDEIRVVVEQFDTATGFLNLSQDDPKLNVPVEPRAGALASSSSGIKRKAVQDNPPLEHAGGSDKTSDPKTVGSAADVETPKETDTGMKFKKAKKKDPKDSEKKESKASEKKESKASKKKEPKASEKKEPKASEKEKVKKNHKKWWTQHVSTERKKRRRALFLKFTIHFSIFQHFCLREIKSRLREGGVPQQGVPQHSLNNGCYWGIFEVTE